MTISKRLSRSALVEAAAKRGFDLQKEHLAGTLYQYVLIGHGKRIVCRTLHDVSAALAEYPPAFVLPSDRRSHQTNSKG